MISKIGAMKTLSLYSGKPHHLPLYKFFALNGLCMESKSRVRSSMSYKAQKISTGLERSGTAWNTSAIEALMALIY
jgi:hypothetical protein